MIVGLGVLKLGEVERRGVLHQPHADTVGEEIPEQALEQGREACKPFSDHGNPELERHEAAQRHVIHRPVGCVYPHRRDHAVDDQLADPQHGERHE